MAPFVAGFSLEESVVIVGRVAGAEPRLISAIKPRVKFEELKAVSNAPAVTGKSEAPVNPAK